ncbi:hypothetical protein CLV62_10495 [Dysgonomonas alginatilytica]|uniref:Uncharacterized protein n=1 Tax=Dysgonomonas alginatilytica TaxID=1605892 RepID=A0A2V3PR17_9BACT|nr:hypothetical protein [Dysgonomonas alginatilytica]PXV66834.1 hypothetical protein CLV62_10495 [Dysgonomonas alginatilytica]
MENIQIQVNLKYETAYFPSSKHKLQRTKVEQETITVNLQKLEYSEVQIAFKVKKYNCRETYFYHNGQLWRKIKQSERNCGKSGLNPMKALIKEVRNAAENLPYWTGNRIIREGDEVHTKECQLRNFQEKPNNYLIIGKHTYTTVGEPRYVVNTFGLGHNHGGTAMFVENWYNSNISNTSYFPADKRKEAIQYGKMVAKRRGDTEYVRAIGKCCDIKIFMPELVTCDPLNQHGEGDKFINRMNSLIDVSGSVLEAGLLVITATNKELNKL